jgi:hypothetical protein
MSQNPSKIYSGSRLSIALNTQMSDKTKRVDAASELRRLTCYILLLSGVMMLMRANQEPINTEIVHIGQQAQSYISDHREHFAWLPEGYLVTVADYFHLDHSMIIGRTASASGSNGHL